MDRRPSGPSPLVATAGPVPGPEERCQRALADLDNLRRRYDRQATREQAAERSRVVAAWLPVVDNLDLALAHAAGDPGGLAEGVRAVRDQAVALLSTLGYQRHDEVGVPFDPLFHEAVGVESDTAAPPGVVLRVVRPGYGEAEWQLRPASVVVSAPTSSLRP